MSNLWSTWLSKQEVKKIKICANNQGWLSGNRKYFMILMMWPIKTLCCGRNSATLVRCRAKRRAQRILEIQQPPSHSLFILLSFGTPGWSVLQRTTTQSSNPPPNYEPSVCWFSLFPCYNVFFSSFSRFFIFYIEKNNWMWNDLQV